MNTSLCYFNNKILSDFYNNNYPKFEKSIFNPDSDIIETDSDYKIEIMLAGFKKEDIKSEIEKNVLKISGERKSDETIKYNKKQSFFGTFEKYYDLPEYIDIEKIDAKFENGILNIIIPKNIEKLNKKILEIK